MGFNSGFKGLIYDARIHEYQICAEFLYMKHVWVDSCRLFHRTLPWFLGIAQVLYHFMP